MIVGGQFTISIILIICALFMARQLRFLQTEKLGYDKEHIIVTEIHDTEESQKYESLKKRASAKQKYHLRDGGKPHPFG